MTWYELKKFCNTLTGGQLGGEVRIWGEGIRCSKVTQVEVLEDDFFNPSGEGCEPVSYYKKDPEEWKQVKDEPIVLTKGTPILTGEI